MRSDFLGDCMEFQGLPEAVNAGLYLIPRMTRDELRSAITGPVAVAGGAIAQRLVLRLLNDLGDDHDQLPVLQHALMRAWEQWETHREQDPSIDLADYEAIGGLQQAMSIHAEEAFREASFNRDPQITERLFKALTDTYSDPRGIRRASSIQELAAVCEASESEVMQVVEIFRRAGRSFLTPHAGVSLEPHTIVDLSHESLMRCWTRLIAWADRERESAVNYIRISQAASWCVECSGGLWIDPQLETGLQWRRKNQPTAAWAERYDSNFAQAMEFLDRSERQRQFERQKEAARKRARQIAIKDPAQNKTSCWPRKRWMRAFRPRAPNNRAKPPIRRRWKSFAASFWIKQESFTSTSRGRSLAMKSLPRRWRWRTPAWEISTGFSRFMKTRYMNTMKPSRNLRNLRGSTPIIRNIARTSRIATTG
jgi:hypothetical protein